MARARNIKPGFFKNELLGEADPIYSLLFAGLWTLADKEGRLEYRPKRIKAELFPYRSKLDLSMAIAWLMDESFISVYEIDQKKYIEVINWRTHQNPHHKEVKSIIPPSSKGEKVILNQEVSHAQVMHESSTIQARIKESASTPLIPDSLNLIPDSLNLDSLNTDSLCASHLPPDKSGGVIDKKSKAKLPVKFTTDHHRIAVIMSNPVKCKYPSMDINLDKWAEDVRLLMETDGYNRGQILQVWNFIIDDVGDGGRWKGWSANCRSPSKLRVKKDGLRYFEIIKGQMLMSNQPRLSPKHQISEQGLTPNAQATFEAAQRSIAKGGPLPPNHGDAK